LVATKPLNVVVQKWTTNAGAAGQSYTQGVQNTQKDWAGLTEASGPNYVAGVQQAIANNRFQNGVAKVGTAAWKAASVTVGGPRYPGGIQAGAPKYQAIMGAVLQVIQGVTLPARGPTGSPANLQRVGAIDQALFAAKQAGTI